MRSNLISTILIPWTLTLTLGIIVLPFIQALARHRQDGEFEEYFDIEEVEEDNLPPLPVNVDDFDLAFATREELVADLRRTRLTLEQIRASNRRMQKTIRQMRSALERIKRAHRNAIERANRLSRQVDLLRQENQRLEEVAAFQMRNLFQQIMDALPQS